MYNPNILLSPLSNVIDVIRRQNSETYDLLITESNIEVVGTETNTGEYNTLAVVNNLDTEGNVTKLGRTIEYNRTDLNKFIRNNTNLIVGKNNIATHHLLSYRDVQTILNPSAAQVSQVLRLHYDLLIDPIDIIVESEHAPTSPFNVDTLPKNNATYPKIVNGTIENSLYTYTGGLVPVSHRTSCPNVTGIPDTTMALGLQVIKRLAPKETIELVLPLIDTDDSWTVMIESMLIAQAETKGNLWLKLTLNTADNVWVLHAKDQLPIRFTGGYLVALRIAKSSNVITIEGEDNLGVKQSIVYSGPNDLITDELQRITAYTSNPLPRVLQFKLKSSSDSTLITEADTLDADPLSNAVYSTVGSPIIITDSISYNYVEDDINRFVSKYDNDTKGSVTRLTQINDTTLSTIDVSVTNFNKYALDGKLKKATICITDVVTNEKVVDIDYLIVRTDIIDRTAELLLTVNGVESPIKTIPLYDLSGMFKVIIKPDNIKVNSADDTLINRTIERVESAPYQYQVEYGIELYAIGTLPTMTLNKTITTIHTL